MQITALIAFPLFPRTSSIKAPVMSFLIIKEESSEEREITAEDEVKVVKIIQRRIFVGTSFAAAKTCLTFDIIDSKQC